MVTLYLSSVFIVAEMIHRENLIFIASAASSCTLVIFTAFRLKRIKSYVSLPLVISIYLVVPIIVIIPLESILGKVSYNYYPFSRSSLVHIDIPTP